MHACHLIELAAVIAAQAEPLLRRAAPLTADGIEAYWIASKCRFDRWGRTLKQHTSCSTANTGLSESPAASIQATLEEILTSEVLTRTFGAVCTASERQRGTAEMAPLVHSTTIGHREARNRALSIMVYGYGMKVEQAVALNRLRRRNERWTDLLLSLIPNAAEVSEFAFNKRRVQDFTWDRSDEHRTMLLASLRMAYKEEYPKMTPNADLNRKIAAGVISCLGADCFGSTGILKSIWLDRISQSATDTQGMIDHLLSADVPVQDWVQQRRSFRNGGSSRLS